MTISNDLEKDSINTKVKEFEESKGHKIFQFSLNVNKIIDWVKKRKNIQTNNNFEWRYEHTNCVCNEPVDRTQPYCPKCGGELVYKKKR